MRIVLIEDDISACNKFIECANARTDIYFFKPTGCSKTGLELVKDNLPDAVILDMELNWGGGSGLDFLEQLKNAELSMRPIVVVTMRNRSERLQDMIHDYNIVEWIFCKKQKGYSQDMVINHLLKLRAKLHIMQQGENPELQTPETPAELKKRIIQRINAELNMVGIPIRLKGRDIFIKGIYNLSRKAKGEPETTFEDISKEENTSYNNILRNAQTAIKHAWDNTPIETLEKAYTAPIRKDIGIPGPTEFLHYYADKIRETM